MIEVALDWILEQVGGTLAAAGSCPSLSISGVCTDTRTLAAGDLFIALKGDNFNGHEFVATAEEKGASAVIASEAVDTDLPVIMVPDTKLALGDLATAVKRQVSPFTIGITGSSGKTTVKEMVAAILSRKGKVLATKGNFNNDIGVPLTLLRLEEDHEYAVVEMGANHQGEIAYTTGLSRPDVATIVNASAAHLEGFGSLFGVARAKSEIFRGLPKGGLALLNADSQFYEFWQGKVRDYNVQTFGAAADTDFRAQDVTLGIDGCAQFDLVTPYGTVMLNLAVPGRHNVDNAMVAAALTLRAGVTLEDVKLGLQNMAQVSGRLNVKQLTSQVRVLDDTYNANVASVTAAIDLLASFSGKRVLVLGDMGELGEKAEFYHRQVGMHARDKRIHRVYSFGTLSAAASEPFAAHGRHFTDIPELIAAMEQDLGAEKCDLIILVKGSRSTRMERVVAALEDSHLGKLQRTRESIAC